jgi:hypothetical protein
MNTEDGIEVEINRQIFKCYLNGDVFRLLKNGLYKFVKKHKNHNEGYNTIGCNGKMICRHRIILFAFTDFDIDNSKIQVDHIDSNRLNNSLDNLRPVTAQENQHNQLHAKGFYWDKGSQKFRAQIKLGSLVKYLGCYNTRWEARQAYLNAIPIYHPSAPIHLYTNDEDDCPF